MSKDFCANGIRIGCTISQDNPLLVRGLKSIASFSRASQLAEHAWENLLEDHAWQETYFRELRRRLGEAYAFVTNRLKERGIPYAAASVSSFLWIDLRKFLREETEEAELELNWRMAREARVWLGMGRAFNAEECGWYRLTFATPREELEEGVRRLEALLDTVEGELRGEGR
jgi:bifunctional pyridoxal-dependent enzyme with beta-cystathionase and maltose regulon repressor activities